MTRLRTQLRGVFKQPTVSFDGDRRYRSLARQLEGAIGRMNDMGRVITPRTPISKAVASLGSQGGRILLSEGTWAFYDLLTINRPNVSLVSMAPGLTKFVRSQSGAVNMIEFANTGCSIDGVRFIDPNVNAGVVKITADRCSVKNCIFEDVGGAVHVTGADWAEITGNHIIDMGYTGVAFDGTCAYGKITNNRFEGSNDSYEDINLAATVTSTIITGNVFNFSDGSITLEVSGDGMQSLVNLEATNSIDRGNITDR